jgi:serpin B
MLILLPAEGKYESVSGGLNEDLFQQMTSGLSSYMVTLTMPRVSFESENKLKIPLQALGMETAFNGSADFSGIDGSTHNLYIDEVYRKAFVAVDEQGTEAAAATAVVIRTQAMKPSAEVVLDRPFIFLIYDQPTGQILFLGHLKDVTS